MSAEPTSFTRSPPSGSTAITIGTFDGVHLGHRALIERARAVVGGSGRVVAMVFEPHPQAVLRGVAPSRLTSWGQRVRALTAVGVDHVERLDPASGVLLLSAERFLREQIERWRPSVIVEGRDFRFGQGRAGDVSMLRAVAADAGVAVEIVDPVEVALGDHQFVPARSTTIRWLLEHGRVSDAAIVLGRPYELEGTVVQGDRRGRTIGFPTANIVSDGTTPADGVYGGRATLPDGRVLSAAVSIGNKPTFGVNNAAVEAYLFDGAAPGIAEMRGKREWTPLEGLSEYGWAIRLEFIAWVRDQVRFAGLPALLDQLGRDVDWIANLVRPAGERWSALPSPGEVLA